MKTAILLLIVMALSMLISLDGQEFEIIEASPDTTSETSEQTLDLLSTEGGNIVDMNILYAPMFTRKSVRKYDMTPLPEETLKQIEKFLSEVTPLLPDAEVQYKIVGPDDVKGMGIPKAPHYILISAKQQPLRHTIVGFHFQHVELYLYSMGYATRWLGMLKPKQTDKDFVIGMAFGKPTEPSSRTLAEFDRKTVSEIAQGTDKRLEAVRTAPSGLNKQPWYFIVEDSSIHVYYKKSVGGIMGWLYDLMDLDVGIALCHLAVATAHEGKPFNFNPNRGDAPTAPKGFIYLGTVE